MGTHPIFESDFDCLTDWPYLILTWKVEKMARQTPLTCSGHTRPVVDLSFSDNTPDGYFLISACKDGNPMLRQGETGDWVGTFIGHKGAVWAATLNKSCSRAATGSADFEAKIWCALTGDEMHSFQHNHIVRSVDFAPDGNKLLTGGQEKKIRLFDLENRNTEPLTLTGHEGTIKRCLFVDQNTIMTIGDDKTFRQWDLRAGAETKKVALGEKSASDLSLHANNKVCTLTYANTVAFYDPLSRQLEQLWLRLWHYDYRALPKPELQGLHQEGGRLLLHQALDHYLHLLLSLLSGGRHNGPNHWLPWLHGLLPGLHHYPQRLVGWLPACI